MGVDKHDFSKNRRRGPKAPVNPPNPPRSVRKPIEPHFSTIPGTSGARIGVPKFCATVWYRTAPLCGRLEKKMP